MLFTQKALEIFVGECDIPGERIDGIVDLTVRAFAPAVDKFAVADKKRLLISRVLEEFDVDFHVVISCLFLCARIGIAKTIRQLD